MLKQSPLNKKAGAATEGKNISPDNTSFPIVAMGASAGGLEAFESFFGAMDCDSNIAFILVAHLDPTHVSLLPELIQKHSKMKVHQVQDGMKVQRNHVYVIPPNNNLSILNGTLQLMELTKSRGPNLPIDIFFRSLAKDQGTNAICIILSGTGTDGTLGLKAIKDEVGMVMVQDEGSAKYDGMPRSAIATGLADYVLPPEKMPGQLIKFTRHAFHKDAPKTYQKDHKIPNALQKIYITLRVRTNHDFSLYKKNTICRRIERRMNIHQIDDINDYARYLQESEREADILFKELLIGVTNFFRDVAAFNALRDDYLPKLLARKPNDYTIRVWVAGCSSGEEAYSIAIILQECMLHLNRHFNVQIFGTDIDEDAINVARAGRYSESIILPDVAPERIKRYFTKDEDGWYRVKKSIREMLVFAPQNVIKDPPFTKLDILSCRNLLIYLDSELQRKLISVFHYSLKKNGILFLGTSESIGQASNLFFALDKKWKIFHRQLATGVGYPSLESPATPMVLEQVATEIPENIKKAEEISALQLVQTILQQSNTPPSAIIDDACNIVYIHGRTGRFLEPAEGRISFNILDMARQGLKAALATAVHKVATQKQEVNFRDLKIDHGDSPLFLDLSVKPVLEQSVTHGLMLVVFEQKTKTSKRKNTRSKTEAKKSKAKTAGELAQELQYTRENLQTTIEELETSNEELKSTNEELQSTNEELQSTNEEMETSKEELQSLNEESATVNAELQSRIDELSRTSDDLRNLLDSTNIATLFLDADLNIRRFTPKLTEIIPLSGIDTGRPIRLFATNLIDVDLSKSGQDVLTELVVRETEVKSQSGDTYTMKIRPYRTVSNRIDGIVITFEDVTARKLYEAQIENHRVFQEALLECTANGIVACDQNGVLSYSNQAACEIHGVPVETSLLKDWTQFYDLYEVDGVTPLKPANIPLVRALKGEQVSDQEYVIAPKGRPARTVIANGRLLVDSAGNRLGAVVSLNDITISRRAEQILRDAERARTEQALSSSEHRYHMLFELASGSIALIDIETGGIKETNQFAYERLGYTKEEFLQLSIGDIETEKDKIDMKKHLKTIVTYGDATYETQHQSKGGDVHSVRVKARAICIDDKQFLLFTWYDI